jgi:hypothetical protein
MAPPASRLSQIWQQHQEQWKRIETLEQNLEEAVMRKRRRIANLLDETPKFRRSHLRLFVTHKTIDADKHEYEIIVEGKLLVGHLDHERAKQIDDALYGGQVNPDVDPSDRSQYRGGIAERESDVPVEPLYFTHLLDQFQATLYTVWQPVDLKSPVSKRQKQKRPPVEENFQTSSKITLKWTRERSETDQNTVATSPDSHAFVLPYACPEVPSTDLQFHSVVVELQLWTRPGEDILYQPSPSLAKALFPQHTNERFVSGRKVKPKKPPSQPPEQDAGEEKAIPLTNNFFVPSLLTMKEIVMAFFHYISFKKLRDESLPSIIKCDKTLQSFFDCERFNFADLQFLLANKNLVTDATTEPSDFTYILSPESHPITLDMDVHVPSLFHYRCRELLRRIKQREFEYTSSRTKARNYLLSGQASEDRVRQTLEDCVTGQGYTSQHVGTWIALARAAPDGSEARQTAQLDAQICFLLEKAENHAKAAQAAWDVVEEFRSGDAPS